MSLRISEVVIDCADHGAVVEFWRDAMGYRREEVNEQYVLLAPDAREPGRPALLFQKVPEAKVVKNRVHLDLNVSGGRGVSIEDRKVRVFAEVERLKALGADDHRGAMDQAGEFWVRMNDPEGNEFCIQ